MVVLIGQPNRQRFAFSDFFSSSSVLRGSFDACKRVFANVEDLSFNTRAALCPLVQLKEAILEAAIFTPDVLLPASILGEWRTSRP